LVGRPGSAKEIFIKGSDRSALACGRQQRKKIDRFYSTLIMSFLLPEIEISPKLGEHNLCFYTKLCTFAETFMLNYKKLKLWLTRFLMNVLHAERVLMNARLMPFRKGISM